MMFYRSLTVKMCFWSAISNWKTKTQRFLILKQIWLWLKVICI